MNSIFSVQNSTNSILQNERIKKEKQNDKMQFANASFSTFVRKTDNLVASASLGENLANLNKTFTAQNSAFSGLNTFALHFDTNKLPQNTKEFEPSAELFERLDELIAEYAGSKGELKDAEGFLLALMKEISLDIDQLGFKSDEFKAQFESYKKQLDKKESLKAEIVELAGGYLKLDTNQVKLVEGFLANIASKLQEYHAASSDSALRNFFAPLMPYLNDSVQENIIKALYTINDEFINPQAFELGGGKRLVWEVDGEKIKFSILSDEELCELFEEMRKSKTFQVVVNSYHQSRADFGVNANLGGNLSSNFDIDSNEKVGLNLDEKMGANLTLNALNLNKNLNSNALNSSKTNSNDSLLKELLKSV